MKPIVFLSHGSRDAEAIMRLKQVLVITTNGTIDFFLSSDGISITPGRNWIDQVFSALSNASLLFTFLSPTSLQSQWVLFEAGLAYSRGIQVVPVGMSGVKVGELPPPLGLLQGFDLDSERGLERMVGVLNSVFSHAHRLRSSAEDFDALVGKPAAPLEDGEYDFQVFSRSEEGETAHETLRVKIEHARMTARTSSWESFGIIVDNRFVGRFKYLRGSSSEDVGMHDFIWNGLEFVGSAGLDSGRWFTENLVWRLSPRL